MTITLAEFERYMENVDFPLAVAVSGGADSLSLLFLAHELAQQKGSFVIALTVDHGLRSESKKEALRVGEWVRARGIQHVILEWIGEKPQSRLQEKAREARYALLTQWCHDHQISTLLLGHHQQDQEETFWLRLSSGSGLTGLSGIKERNLRNGIRFLRPLLNYPKERLKDTLIAQGQEWIEDPSNHKPHFFRGRLRHFLQEEGLSSSRLEQVMKKLQIDADFIQDALEKAIIQTVEVHESGYLSIKKSSFYELHPALSKRLLSFLMQWFSHGDYSPRTIQLTRVIERIKVGSSFTAGGIYWCMSPETIFLFRERRAMRGELLMSLITEKILWDQRFVVDGNLKNHVPKETMLGPLGVSAITRQDVNTSIPSRAWPTLPALWLKGKVVAVPHLCYTLLECEEDLKKYIYLKPFLHDSLRFTI